MNNLNVKKAFVFLILLIFTYVAIVFSLSNSMNDISSDLYMRRFWNAILTSYMIGSFLFLLTLVMYAESRNVPFAPTFGMLASGAVAALLMLWVLPNLDVELLEGNGTPMAQLLTNVLRFSSTLLAAIVSSIIVFGLFYSMMLPSKLEIQWKNLNEEE
ncbi:MAG: hypothetical protein O2866_04090 [archaeon]|nr:hypothetical protein [archaeon]MDA0842965.1 hypothetical protein [archaeon]MDA1168044.1 hypothetical protein [archaeon]